MPTIDPNDFADAGSMGLTDADLANYNPPVVTVTNKDPGLNPPGSPGWTALQQRIGLDADAEEDRHVRAQKTAQARLNALNGAIQAEANEHQRELTKAAAAQQLELETALGCLEPAVAQTVRMHAYLRAMDAGHGSRQERQIHADQLALKIAKYLVEGRAE